MKKRYITSLLILMLTIPACAQTPDPVNFGPDFKLLGKLKPRTTQEIAGSDLWIGGEVLDRDYADYHAYKGYLDSLGAKKIRLQSGWAKTEKVKGQYDFEWLDSIVDDALSRKIEPWLQISYGNTLYPDAGGISLGEGLPTSEEAYEGWLNYTRALVNHFKGRVTKWEIWNEADHRYNDMGPEAYAKLYYETAKVVREVQPSAHLIGLSMAGVGRTEYIHSFFKFLKERNGLDLIDAVTFHGYPKNPDYRFDDVDRFREAVYQYRPGLELWQGETGCPSSLGSSGALSGHPWTELTQAKWNLRRALAFVGRGIPFSLFTISEYTYNSKKFKGLNTKGILKVNDDLSIAYAKPAYYAYQNLTSVLDHQMERLPVLPIEAKSDSSVALFAFRHKLTKAPMLFVWQDGSIPDNENTMTKATLEIGGITFKEPVLVDLYSGKVYAMPQSSYNARGTTYTFSELPVYDSPTVITDRASLQLRD